MDNNINNESEEENIQDMDEACRNIQRKFHRNFVSGWPDDDDDEGIEEEGTPHETNENEILWGAENGDIELVKKLLNIDKKLTNSTDKDGYTPLHRAAYNDHLEVLELLIEAGANLNAETVDGWTPLHSACHWNRSRCAEKLMSLNVDVNAKSQGGITPLHLAASNNGIETLQALLLHPTIDSSIKNNSNETAYEIAIRKGRFGKFFEAVEPCFNFI